MVAIGLKDSVTALPTCSILWQSLPPVDGSFRVEAPWIAFLFACKLLAAL